MKRNKQRTDRNLESLLEVNTDSKQQASLAAELVAQVVAIICFYVFCGNED